jgi:ankyrin repeat protein
MPVDVRDEYGSTLLIIACQNGNKRVAKQVLRRGADINCRNYKGNTPLHYCYQYGYGDTLGQYLISKVRILIQAHIRKASTLITLNREPIPRYEIMRVYFVGMAFDDDPHMNELYQVNFVV